MIASRPIRRIWIALSVIVTLMLMLGGCAAKRVNTEAPPGAESAVEKGPTPLYYDFGDVLVPSELEVDKDGSFVFRTPGFSAGVLSLKGRVEINSLIDFFNSNMAKDNWRLVSSFKSRRTIMLFHKENRWCVINITEKEFYTYAEIWVSPTISEGETGLLK